MEAIEKVLIKIRDARKDKGYSHENMAMELGISQGAYTNLENNESRLSVERLIQIAQILDKPIYSFFEVSPQNIFNQNLKDNSIGHQQVQNLYHENRETLGKLLASYEQQISNMQEIIDLLKKDCK